MDIIVGTLIFITIICLWIYFFRSDSNENSSIPYVKHERYPIIGHLFSLVRDRKKFLLRCQQRYGLCFKTRFFNQCLTFVLSPSDWAAILRNPAFYYPDSVFARDVFGASLDYSSNYWYLFEIRLMNRTLMFSRLSWIRCWTSSSIDPIFEKSQRLTSNDCWIRSSNTTTDECRESNFKKEW